MISRLGSPEMRVIPEAAGSYCMMNDGQDCAALDSNGECKVYWVNVARDRKGLPLRSQRCIKDFPNGGRLVALKS